MGQEKTQRENSREQRNEQQGRLEGGWASGSSSAVPVGQHRGQATSNSCLRASPLRPKVLGPRRSCPGPQPATELPAEPALDQGPLHTRLSQGTRILDLKGLWPEASIIQISCSTKGAEVWRGGPVSAPRLPMHLCCKGPTPGLGEWQSDLGNL